MLDRGEARTLSFSKECQSPWLYLPINRDNHHASIPAQGIALSKIQTEEEEEEKEEERRLTSIKHCQKRPTIEAKETYYFFTE